MDPPKGVEPLTGKEQVTGVLTYPCFIETAPKWDENFVVGFPAGARVTITIEEELPGFELQEDCDKVNRCLVAHPDVQALFRRG